MQKGGNDELKTALNIVLLPDKTVFNKALSFSNKITQKLDCEFELNGNQFRPHITLYQGYYPDRNVQALFDALENISKQNQQIEVQMGNFDLSHGTFVFWSCVKTSALQKLHDKIIEKINPLREGNIAPNTLEMLPGLPDNEKAMVKATGSILNKELFYPHITLTRLKNASDGPSALRLIGQEDKVSFVPSMLAVAHLGPQGTISKIVTEIPIK